MQTITADTWKAKRKQPKVVTLASLDGAKIILRPMSALRRTELEKLHAEADGGKFGAALIADTAVSGDVDGDTVLSLGGPIWKAEDFDGEDFPAATLDALTVAVVAYLAPADANAKHSIPASGSPAV